MGGRVATILNLERFGSFARLGLEPHDPSNFPSDCFVFPQGSFVSFVEVAGGAEILAVLGADLDGAELGAELDGAELGAELTQAKACAFFLF